MSDRPTDMRYAGIVAGKLPNGGDAGVGVALPTHSLPLSIGKGSCNRYRYRIPRQFCPKLRLRLRADAHAPAVDSEGLPSLTPEATVFLNKAIDFLRVSMDSQPTKGGQQ